MQIGGRQWCGNRSAAPARSPTKNLATRLNLSEPELREAEEHSSTTARVVYETVRREGEDELKRSSPALACSGLAAGLSMGFSLGRIRHCHSGTPAIVHGEYADPDSSAFAQRFAGRSAANPSASLSGLRFCAESLRAGFCTPGVAAAIRGARPFLRDRRANLDDRPQRVHACCRRVDRSVFPRPGRIVDLDIN